MEGERAQDPLSAFRLPRGRHGIPPEQVAESQRWRMLGAAAEVLAERGYARATASDVTARAGVSQRTFYEQFDDIAGCLLAAYEMVAECVCDLASAACEGEVADERPGDSRELPDATADHPGRSDRRLRAALDEVLAFLAEEPALAHLLGAEAPAGVPAIAAARGGLLDRLAALGPPRPAVEGALALVSSQVAAGEAADLPRLAPQLAELLAPAGQRRPAEP